jgi:hypothetical protein
VQYFSHGLVDMQKDFWADGAGRSEVSVGV